MSSPSDRLRELERIAREAGGIAKRARESLRAELKSDGTTVTNADREVETWLRKELPGFVPSTTVWGEEFGIEAEGPGGQWLVDPVDGTSNFAVGSPLWGVSIGLLRQGQMQIGAIYLPDLDEMYLGEQGSGAFVDGRSLPAIPSGEIRPNDLVSYAESLLRRKSLNDLPGKPRLSGAFVVDGVFVIRQRLRGLMGMNEKLYDLAACVLMAQELGADVRYADGSPMVLSELQQDFRIGRPWVIFPCAEIAELRQ